ncbi:MAG: PPK2 family polyphosphate kinase [Nesterenkonia sp.]
MGSASRLDVDLTGVPGPKTEPGPPFDGDPRVLWRAAQHDSPLDLSDIPTRSRTGFEGKKRAGRKALAARSDLLADLQELLWAHEAAAPQQEKDAVLAALAARAPQQDEEETSRRRNLFGARVEKALDALTPGPRVLLVLQGMDAAGKGGMVKSVVGAMDPLGVDVTAFGKPTEEQARQHYLQRIIAQLPSPGHVGVFDRSHYEDVLVPTVTGSHSEDEVADRVEALQIFERDLVRRGFVIVKVMLHISPEEQLQRLMSRLDREHKHWKYRPADAEARAQFNVFQTVYAGLLEATDADHAPWHIIAADRKWYARLAVQELLIAALADLNLKWPAADYDVEKERRRLRQSETDRRS